MDGSRSDTTSHPQRHLCVQGTQLHRYGTRSRILPLRKSSALSHSRLPFRHFPLKRTTSLEPNPPFSTPAPTQTDRPSQRTLRLMILLVSSSSSSESRRWFYFYCSPVLAPFFRSRPADDDVVCAWRFAWVRCARALPLSLSFVSISTPHPRTLL